MKVIALRVSREHTKAGLESILKVIASFAKMESIRRGYQQQVRAAASCAWPANISQDLVFLIMTIAAFVELENIRLAQE